MQRAVHGAVILAGGLDNDELDIEDRQLAFERLVALFGVGYAERQIDRVHVNVEPVFAGIDSGANLGLGAS